MIVSKRFTLVDKEDLQLDLEYTEHYAILHLPRMRMSRSSYIDFLNIVPELHAFITTAGYEAIWTAIEPENKVTQKLLDRLGAKKLGSHSGLDVYEYRGEK